MSAALAAADWLARYEAAGGGYVCTPDGRVMLTSTMEADPRTAPMVWELRASPDQREAVRALILRDDLARTTPA